jgi:superfamily II DNA or RNA helicase
MVPLSSLAVTSSTNPVSFPIYTETFDAIYVPKYFGLQRYCYTSPTETNRCDSKSIKKSISSAKQQKHNEEKQNEELRVDVSIGKKDDVGAAGGELSVDLVLAAHQEVLLQGVPDLSSGSTVEFTGSLRKEQEAAVDKYMCAARDPRKTGGILSLPCGQGKTVIALKIISMIKKKTLIVVHKDFLLNQWRERISQFLPGASVGLIKGPTVDVAARDIVIGSVQSLSMKSEYGASILDEFGLLVVDECHRVGTEVFSRALMKTCFMYTLGLSATVERKDGMSKAFIGFLGDVVHRGTPRTDTVRVAQVVYHAADEAYCREEVIKSIGKPNMSRMINNVTAFAPRTALIVGAIAAVLQLEPLRKVLVLSDRKSQLVHMMRALREDHGVEAGYYYGGLKPQVLAESETKAVLLATFAYAAEGMDCRGLDTLFMVSPKSDIEQSCGRILREQAHERIRVPLIVDVADGFSVFQYQAKKRLTYYKKNKYGIISIRINGDDAAAAETVKSSLRGIIISTCHLSDEGVSEERGEGGGEGGGGEGGGGEGGEEGEEEGGGEKGTNGDVFVYRHPL